MPFHYVLPGRSALDRHETHALLTRLQGIDTAVAQVEARYFYLLASSEQMTDDDRRRLQALLDETPAEPFPDDGALSIHVTARIGTLSAWSSKATDIAHNCALSQVRRIERGLHYRIRRKGRLFGTRP